MEYPGPASEPAVLCLLFRQSQRNELLVLTRGKKTRLPGDLIDHSKDSNGLTALGRVLSAQVGLSDVSRAMLFTLFHQPNRAERRWMESVYDVTFTLVWALAVPDDWEPTANPRKGEPRFVSVNSPEFPELADEHGPVVQAWRHYLASGQRPLLGVQSARPAVFEVFRRGTTQPRKSPFTAYTSAVIAGRSDEQFRFAVSLAPKTEGLLRFPRCQVRPWEHDMLPAAHEALRWHGLSLTSADAISLFTVEHGFPALDDWAWDHGGTVVPGRLGSAVWGAVVHPREEGLVNLHELRWVHINDLKPESFVEIDRPLVRGIKHARAYGDISQGIC